MNNEFKNYVRESAFNLSLSKRQVNVILSLAGFGVEDERLNLHPYFALQRKGLIHHENRSWHLTKEGEIVCDLLVCAGYIEVKKDAAKTY